MMPRLGFLGVGWIGLDRMQAIARARCAQIVAIADPSPERRAAAAEVVPTAALHEHLGQLLEHDLDGIAIATPSALHADQAIDALGRGMSVFCQKPLARDAAETRRVLAAARTADRLLAVDLSYRHTAAVRAMREVVRAGGIGRPFAVDLTFHNAYGPDAAWFYDRASSGGGCVIDLGVHLVDLALWLLDWPPLLGVDSVLFSAANPLARMARDVEDFASVQMRVGDGIAIRLACSWRVSAGRDAVIGAALYGSEGGVAMHNVNGSFYDFVAERYRGTHREQIAAPPDDWGGRAAVEWAEQLSASPRYSHDADRFADLARALDEIYAGALA